MGSRTPALRPAGMALPRLVSLGLVLLAVGASAAPPRCLDDAEVCLETRSERGVVELVASNRTAAPYSLRIAPAGLVNLRAVSPTPFRAVLEPGETRTVGRLAAMDPGRDTAWRYTWSAAPGSLLARHDPRARYRMPFGGSEPRVLGQGVGGHFSHTGPGHHAFDFSMPWGTPVLAARAGRVIAVRDDRRATGARRGSWERANAVEVLQADGTIATYAHLQRGAAVRVGERVETGDLLGRSGDTGFSTGPHLHFMVWRRTADLGWQTLPIRFDDGSTAGFVPTAGLAYAPTCVPGRRGCPSQSAVPEAPSRHATPATAPVPAARREGGACVCGNGARIHVDLPCERVCGR